MIAVPLGGGDLTDRLQLAVTRRIYCAAKADGRGYLSAEAREVERELSGPIRRNPLQRQRVMAGWVDALRLVRSCLKPTGRGAA